MFEQFEEDAVRAIMAARDVAAHLGHLVVGSEHILVGLASTDPKSLALLAEQGSSAAALTKALVAIAGQNHGQQPQDFPFGPDAQRALAHSWAIAEEFHHSTVSPRHLLLAILTQAPDSSRGATLLMAAGVDPSTLASATRRALNPPARPNSGRGGFQELDLEFTTAYGPVTLTLLRKPGADRQAARVISLAADTLHGPEDVRTFLSELDRLLDANANKVSIAFLMELFSGLGSRLDAYLTSGAPAVS